MPSLSSQAASQTECKDFIVLKAPSGQWEARPEQWEWNVWDHPGPAGGGKEESVNDILVAW